MTKCDKCKDPDYLETIFEHCQLDPETQAWERRVAYFFKANPKIFGLSYTAADVLRLEKNLKIRNAAISLIHEEIENRRNNNAEDYSLIRRKVSAERVREIVNKQRILLEGTDIQREKLAKAEEEEAKEKEAIYTCPFFLDLSEEEKTKYECRGALLIKSIKRDKIVSLRVTEGMDDALSFLSSYLDVKRSLLVSGLLELKIKYPEAIL
jgi:hypothetical protein